ncbi:hypothetical protein TSTA_104560 [Talaromyces stipitatus ATCC 10500]|uniref:Uncharacterized protein n=1 Tax=Talaromyces stipitatus (strain ATCC 10500 / CBS 375.48 / QM 6759 / NRRL 1006) TaxID=441959 RepID=B8MP03_TALSN|nr:uncharacterized protein TSTA_104560 [Talaromyces stipitatus ATCC 10500]EED14242.1 hypothetical protein TSTA_104560 [Talaromyces stipitatus ATCC 10500]
MAEVMEVDMEIEWDMEDHIWEVGIMVVVLKEVRMEGDEGDMGDTGGDVECRLIHRIWKMTGKCALESSGRPFGSLKCIRVLTI